MERGGRKSLCAEALALCAPRMAILPHIPWCSVSQCRNSRALKLQAKINVLALIFFCQVFSTSNRKVWRSQSLDLNNPFFFSYSFLSKEWPAPIILGRVQDSWRREWKWSRPITWSGDLVLEFSLPPPWMIFSSSRHVMDCSPPELFQSEFGMVESV